VSTVPSDPQQPPDASEAQPFTDLTAFVRLRRLTGLILSPDGTRLVAVCQEPDSNRGRYVSSLWEVDPAGERDSSRLTRSEQGESTPAFLADGSVLFVSARPRPDGDAPDDETALWVLPPSGEPHLLSEIPGGVSDPVVAVAAGRIVVAGSRLPGSADQEGDRRRREERRNQKVTGIVHDGMPIRYWDHELDDVSPRLFLVGTNGAPVDLAPDAASQLHTASYSVSTDGSLVASTWRERLRRGRAPQRVVTIDVDTGKRTEVAGAEHVEYGSPTLSPDGRWLAVIREDEGSFDEPLRCAVEVLAVGEAGPPVSVEIGELHPNELAWSADSRRLFIAGDRLGRGGVLRVDLTHGPTSAAQLIAADAVYASLCPNQDGTLVYAIRSTLDSPPAPVRLAVESGDPTPLPTPARVPAQPGSLHRLQAVAPDGTVVPAWLAVPHAASAEHPVAVQVWIHGGPFSSWNSWNWRWCPWVAVARGYAVLMPDPGLSTGYGQDWLARGWPHRAAVVWADIEATLDAALERPELDGGAVACLGASFGGYMTNWIAGHTDRFGAIVTHAGLWALDQQHATTDAAAWKSGLFGTVAEHPDWYAANSPHHFVDAIHTPMLVVHGNRDYRVPVSEALRLWWDLVSRFDGPPDELPHRFLQFTGENHWVLSPANAELWYATVTDFVDRHLRR
jgi:dipeptidyl aminopeptidase/acylaminoacyl peptidase